MVVVARRATVARGHYHGHSQRCQLLQCGLRSSFVALPVVPLRVAEQVRVAHHLRPRRIGQRCDSQQRRQQRRLRARHSVEAVGAGRIGLEQSLYIEAGLVAGHAADGRVVAEQVDSVVVVVRGGVELHLVAHRCLEVSQVQRREGLIVQRAVHAEQSEAAHHCADGTLSYSGGVALIVVVGSGQQGGRENGSADAKPVGGTLTVRLLRLHAVHQMSPLVGVVGRSSHTGSVCAHLGSDGHRDVVQPVHSIEVRDELGRYVDVTEGQCGCAAAWPMDELVHRRVEQPLDRCHRRRDLHGMAIVVQLRVP